jgi:hypothetical protein
MVAATSEWINAKVLIPDLLQAAPQTRPVLDRYGLRGCGGPLGPVESLEFFAKAHDVPLPRLLEELRRSYGTTRIASAEETSSLADAIYRPFFKAGILVVLTLGAVWGAYLLLRIAFAGSFQAVGLHEVNAHGHAQIFGWVGLFVMGFAYQAFPRFKHTILVSPRLAYSTLILMLLGISARSMFEPLVTTLSWAGVPALGGSLLEVFAITVFVGIILQTWRTSGKPLAVYDYYILAAMGWFIVQAVYEAVYFAATLNAADADGLISLVATWQGSLRDIQIHGFAMLMILGVSQRIFHHFYDLPAPHPRRAAVVLGLLNAAIIAEALGLILMRLAGHGWAALWYTGVITLTISVAMLVYDWHIFGRVAEADRNLKFLRAAYVWLFVSLAMLVALPAYQFGLLPWLAPEGGATRLGFSHAYYGAIRHAITVGFISLMIVGVAAKVVPTLNGVNVRGLSALWAPFLLLNAGCTLRVVGQTVTDFTDCAFPFAGVSGVLEVTGLALWGVHLWLVMIGKARVQSADACCPSCADGSPLVAGHRVGDVLDRYPYLLETFLAFGFRPLANPLFRKTVARFVTLEQACRQTGANLDRLLEALNAARAKHERTSLSLPVLIPS